MLSNIRVTFRLVSAASSPISVRLAVATLFVPKPEGSCTNVSKPATPAAATEMSNIATNTSIPTVQGFGRLVIKRLPVPRRKVGLLLLCQSEAANADMMEITIATPDAINKKGRVGSTVGKELNPSVD